MPGQMPPACDKRQYNSARGCTAMVDKLVLFYKVNISCLLGWTLGEKRSGVAGEETLG